MKIYYVRRASAPYEEGDPEGRFWSRAEVAKVDEFPWYESGERWRAEARLLYDDEHLYFRMDSWDRHIVGLHTEPNQPVYLDSCAELFIKPGTAPELGYFNFEINCVGTMLLAFGTGRAGRVFVTPELARQVHIWHSIPGPVKYETAEDRFWAVEAVIPFAVMRAYTELLPPMPGSEWRGNFQRCADGSSNPQWSCWNRIETERPDFHRPEFFGRLVFV